MKICMLSTSHRPDDDRVYFKEVRSLARRYGKVGFIYPDPGSRPPDDDRVAFMPFRARGGPLRRMYRVRAAYHRGLEAHADVYHCHEPESLAAGIVLKKELGSKLVFDSHEMYGAVLAGRFPEVLWNTIEECYRPVERHMLKQCDAVIGATWGIGDYFRSILGEDRVRVLLNAPATDVFGEGSPHKDWGDVTVVCHDGFLGFDRGLKTIAEAIRIASKKHAVVLKIVGDVFGKERSWLDAFTAKHGMNEAIVRTGWLPYEQVGRAIRACHIGLLAFRRCPNHEIAMPNKMFNYMMYGLPFIGPAFMTALQRIEQEDGCCVLADQDSPDSYADAICRMVKNRGQTLQMADNALKVSREKYRWEHMEPVLVDLYTRLQSSSHQVRHSHEQA